MPKVNGKSREYRLVSSYSGAVPRETPQFQPASEQLLRGELSAARDSREQLLAGAAKAFRKLGLREARVEDVLAAADISRGTFYKFFRGKEDVALALFDLALSVLAGELALAITRASTPEERWEGAVRVFLKLQVEHGALVQELLLEAGRIDSRIGERRAELIDRAVELLASGLGKTGKQLDPWLVRSVLLAIEGLVQHSRAERGGKSIDVERLRRIAIELYERLLS